MPNASAHLVTDLAQLRAIYDTAPLPPSLVKETDHVHPLYRPYIEASPFAVLATFGPAGLDVSPRGDGPGFVTVEDDRTLLLPDRRGNNRIDSLRNILHDPRVALLFLVPGIGETIRVNGRAVISTEPKLLERLAVGGKTPRTVLVVTVEKMFFQCARAILRSELWNPARHRRRQEFPSPGQILAGLSDNEVGGEPYDQALPARQKATLY